MSDLDTQTAEEHRIRYLELKAGARARGAALLAEPTPPEIVERDVLARYIIPGGWYWHGRLRFGQGLRIIDSSGRNTVSALFWNARDTSERYNAGDTVKLQWTALLGAGKCLFSDMGRVLASITADSGHGNDTILGGSTPASNLRRYGESRLRNTRDNFLLAAGKIGLSPQDVGACIAFFAPVRTDMSGAFIWREQPAAPGQLVDIRAEMDILVALSNCPHPLDPSPRYDPKPVEVIVRREAAIGADDPCRNASEEAVRGFENTAAYRMEFARELRDV